MSKFFCTLFAVALAWLTVSTIGVAADNSNRAESFRTTGQQAIAKTRYSTRQFQIELRLNLAKYEITQKKADAVQRRSVVVPVHPAKARLNRSKPISDAGRVRTALDLQAGQFGPTALPLPPQISLGDVSALPVAAKLAEDEKAEKESDLKPGESVYIDLSRTIPHPNARDFACSPTEPESVYHDGAREAWVYDEKHNVPTQRPLVEWGRKWYSDGITPRGINLFGEMNMVRPKFYVYGDYRTGIQGARNAGGRADNWASRLNLDMDFQVTDAGRFHSFVGPLDEGGRFTRWELVNGDLKYQNEMDLTPVTAFYEGDLGEIIAGRRNSSSPFELPFTLGLIPLLYQNGIWMEDAVAGAAFALPARHSNLLNWSNFDASFFAVFDELNSPAFEKASDAQAFGGALFIEAYGGYIETGYAYLNHRNDSDFSYHNATFSFTRRYFQRISNSVRVIVNAGQDLEKSTRTADGGLLLVENSWITAAPLTFVPYMNFFYGWDRPQSVARAGLSGGILRNSGLNFDTDGLNGFPTLDTSAADTAGVAMGVDLIGDDLDRQLVLEFAALTPHGGRAIAQGNQYGVGARYQFALSNATLLRFDVMHGWRGNQENVYGTRMEYRWKF